MKTKIMFASVFVLTLFCCVFVWLKRRHFSSLPQVSVSEQVSTEVLNVKSVKNQARLKKESADFLQVGSSEKSDVGLSRTDLAALYPELQSELKQLEETAAQMEITDTDRIEMWEASLRRAEAEKDREMVDLHHGVLSQIKSRMKWDANRHIREKAAAEWRLETEVFEKEQDTWKREMIEKLSPIAHFEVEEIDGKINIIAWDFDFDALYHIKVEQDTTANQDTASYSSTISSELSQLPEAAPVSTTTNDPLIFQTQAATQFESWRKGLDQEYFDVVVSRFFTPKELDKYFPTASDRENLTRRTSEMQKSVVSQVRKLVDDVKGATPDQKRSLARDLVTKNFDKDFAQAVLSELEKETE